MLSPARGLHASMALPALALTFFLALASPLLARGQKRHGSENPRAYQEAEKCQKPQWDSRFIFDQEQGTFNPNEVVKMWCPEGYWPPPMEIKCVTLKPREGSTIPRSGWIVRNGTDTWHVMEGNLTCVDVLQVVPETLKVSSTSIKLNWTCMLPHMCQHIRARCQLEQHFSPNCEAEEVKVEEILQGQEGIFTCSALQPFTVYAVTISLLPSTVLYTRLIRTKEMVPDKPEKLWLDHSTGSLRWKALPSCKGEIIGYQLNITTMRAEDGSFLEFSQVLVNQSVSEYMPPHQTAGSKYLVTVQGLTAAGAGAASQLEFQTYILVSGQPLGPWPGSAVTVVVVVVLLIPLSAGIIWFVLFRKKKKALPSKAEEDQYTELQPYENVHGDNYCKIETFLEKDEGKYGQAGEPFPKLLPVQESQQ
uniref:Fibronectin type-III domain-containing protein n=1 Tax=Taeniopygia guttata TaxID=59729 RepID=A0A674HMV0_TAEGU